MEKICELSEVIKKIEEAVKQIEEDSKKIICYAIFDLNHHSFKCLYDSIKCCFKIQVLLSLSIR